MDFPFEKTLKSEQDTEVVAKQFAAVLKKGNIVLLNGDLGSGKTFLVKKICESFGIGEVTSPTFSIVNEYFGKFGIYHFDFYRLNKMVELDDIGFDEYLEDIEALIFIEWADMFPEILPEKNIYRVDFSKTTDEEREISIKFIS